MHVYRFNFPKFESLPTCELIATAKKLGLSPNPRWKELTTLNATTLLAQAAADHGIIINRTKILPIWELSDADGQRGSLKWNPVHRTFDGSTPPSWLPFLTTLSELTESSNDLTNSRLPYKYSLEGFLALNFPMSLGISHSNSLSRHRLTLPAVHAPKILSFLSSFGGQPQRSAFESPNDLDLSREILWARNSLLASPTSTCHYSDKRFIIESANDFLRLLPVGGPIGGSPRRSNS